RRAPRAHVGRAPFAARARRPRADDHPEALCLEGDEVDSSDRLPRRRSQGVLGAARVLEHGGALGQRPLRYVTCRWPRRHGAKRRTGRKSVTEARRARRRSLSVCRVSEEWSDHETIAPMPCYNRTDAAHSAAAVSGDGMSKRTTGITPSDSPTPAPRRRKAP